MNNHKDKRIETLIDFSISKKYIFTLEDVLAGPVEVGPHHHHDRHHDQEGIRGQAVGSETVEQV